MIFVLFFIISIFFAFYVPGRVFLGEIKLSILAKATVSIISGIVLWALQGVVFGYMHARWLSYGYLLLMFFIFIKEKYYVFRKPKEKFLLDIISILIIAVGGAAQILPYFRTGWQTANGTLVTGNNTSDHIWHGALVRQLINRFPPDEPSMAGVALKDYHYFYNLVTADLIRVFHLPFFATQFDGMYILAPILFGAISYCVLQKIYPSKLFTRLSLFFLFFAGNAAGWVMLILGHGFNWKLESLIIDASKLVDSPPYAYALITGLSGFFLLLTFKDKLPKKIIFLCCIIFGTLLEFKVHTGIPLLAGFGAYAVWYAFKKKFTPLISFIFAVVLAFTLLKLNSSNTAGLAFVPVDIPRDFINQGIIHLTDWQLRWNVYYNHHNFLRLVEYGFFMSCIYLIVQFGILLLGLIPNFKKIKILTIGPSLFLYSTVICAFIFGLFFYQTVGGANIWEFFLIALPVLSILTALGFSLFLDKKPLFIKLPVIIFLVAVIVPQWFISVNKYINEEFFSGFQGISKLQANSYNFLNSKVPKNSLVMLAGPDFDSYTDIANLFVERDIYFSGNGVRQIKTPVLKKRREEEENVSTGQNSSIISGIIRGNKISYVYYYGSPSNKGDLIDANLDIVFTNKAATIFRTQP